MGSASPSRLSLSLGPSVSLEPMTVPYLSPLVLRKEVENLLEHEGDDCLLSAGFVDHHPILYWNLVWYFKRLNLPSHLPELCLQAVSLVRDRQIPEQWQSLEGKTVVISCCWDNPRLHTNMVPFMYSQLGKNNMSSLVQSLVTEDTKPTKSLRERVLGCVQQSNVREAVELLVRERNKARSQQRRPSLYRDVLFLSLATLGKDALNQNLFYRDYIKIYDELAARRSALFKYDKYPSVRAMLCRKYFRDLELKPFSLA
uniref:Putative c-myc promoter-binding protein n=1 Tax=Amblyomma cajennense TaxID=34607 RepID=A0A023FGU5_AMBCJ